MFSMNKIKNIFLFLLLACPLWLGASEPKETAKGAIAPLVKQLEILRERFRPFISIALEFTIEQDYNGTWIMMERHRLMEDTQTGFFRDQIMIRSSPNKEHQYYKENLWNGDVCVTHHGSARFGKELKFVDRDESVAGSAIISSGRACSFCSFFLFWDGGGPDGFHAFLKNLEKEIKNAKTDGKQTTIPIGEMFRISIDNASGQLLQKVSYLPETETTSYEYYRLDVNKSIIKDGWQIPVEYVCTRRSHQTGEIASKIRVKVVPESVKINLNPEEFDLKVRLPIGAKVQDIIRQVDYTVTKMDSFGKEKVLKEKLDALLEKAEKQK